ncbi:MAG: hypothetical protein HC840_20430 [Leptolyngbyaceae cyanobacterium RM2_2_4]|nr:hypothetical protein [Leptolyngbyaceae cyanobacterium SM1_4_3]NJO51406.1 hypothetical protein [Leptolyngbyaceae cyanobacterium RM2_2_4]
MQRAYPMALGIFLGLLISSGIASAIMKNDVSEARLLKAGQSASRSDAF